MWQDSYSNNHGLIRNSCWEKALRYCHELDMKGYHDWRLPNINELKSIVDRNLHSPALSPVFQRVSLGNFWSSTTLASSPDNAWTLYMNYGNTSYGDKTYGYFVRCVRGGDSYKK